MILSKFFNEILVESNYLLTINELVWIVYEINCYKGEDFMIYAHCLKL